MNLSEEYDVLQTVGEGWFAKVLLAEHRRTRVEVVLKAVSKDATSRREFFREFHYSYYLSPHPAVLKTYDVAFESDRHFFFAQVSPSMHFCVQPRPIAVIAFLVVDNNLATVARCCQMLSSL